MPKLTDDLMGILCLIQHHGASYCAGTCEHRKPGELHCHAMGQALGLSSTGVKNRMQRLIQLGLLDRRRVERADGKVLGCVTLTSAGSRALSANGCDAHGKTR